MVDVVKMREDMVEHVRNVVEEHLVGSPAPDEAVCLTISKAVSQIVVAQLCAAYPISVSVVRDDSNPDLYRITAKATYMKPGAGV